jgi:hypothetical protein
VWRRSLFKLEEEEEETGASPMWRRRRHIYMQWK